MTNIFPAQSHVSRTQREKRQNHRGMVLWLIGLSGAGKTTLAIALEKKLFDKGRNVFGLDGDTLRNGLNKGLGFSLEDRTENLRRAGEIAHILCSTGTIVIASFITPLESDRNLLKSILGENFHDCFLDVSLETCESRDPKGLYKKARAGELKNMTGIDSPFERPIAPKLQIRSSELNFEQLVEQVFSYVEGQISL